MLMMMINANNSLFISGLSNHSTFISIFKSYFEPWWASDLLKLEAIKNHLQSSKHFYHWVSWMGHRQISFGRSKDDLDVLNERAHLQFHNAIVRMLTNTFAFHLHIASLWLLLRHHHHFFCLRHFFCLSIFCAVHLP